MMKAMRAFKFSSGLFLLLCLSIWVSKVFDYPHAEIIYDQDAVIQGVWRFFAVMLSLAFSGIVFVVLMFFQCLRAMVIRLYRASH